MNLTKVDEEHLRPGQRAFVVGISGPSCSGKTTITRIIRNCLGTSSFVIYQDDFYKPEDDIPVDPLTVLKNWDCPEAVDFGRLNETLEHVRCYYAFPEEHESTEEKNTHDGSGELDPAVSIRISNMLAQLKAWAVANRMFLIIVDGFMLFHEDRLSDRIDLKIWLTSSFETMKERREKRQGYVTQDGYWCDPPYYFEKIVWPEYKLMHKHYVEHLADDSTVLKIDSTVKSIDEMAMDAVKHLCQHMCSAKSADEVVPQPDCFKEE